MYLIAKLILLKAWDKIIKIETIVQQPGLIKSLVEGIATISNIENILMGDYNLVGDYKVMGAYKGYQNGLSLRQRIKKQEKVIINA